MANKKGIPRVWFFVLAVIVGLGGVGGFVYFLLMGIFGIQGDLIRLEAPGAEQIQLKTGGLYTVFLEMPRVVEHEGIDPYEVISGLAFRLETRTGAQVPLRPPKGRGTYSVGDRYGVSIMEFDAPGAGSYRFVTSFENKRPDYPIVLTLAQGFIGGILRTILKAGGVFSAGIVGAVLLLVLGLTVGRKKKPAPSRLESTERPGAPDGLSS
ncbi:MAG: hypothetical protein KKB20_19245 [Proteobacteria bacterium]|nr:hypothetical protein [Pseudomonadota bacterium]